MNEDGTAKVREHHDAGLREHDAASPRGGPRSVSDAIGSAPDRLLHDWKQAHKRCVAYLTMLDVDAAEAESIAAEAVQTAVTRQSWESGGDSLSEALRAMREIVLARHPLSEPVADDLDPFVAWRMNAAACAGGGAERGSGRSLPRATPPLARRWMPLAKLVRRFSRPRTEPADESAAGARARRSVSHEEVYQGRRHLPWTRVARRRRMLLGLLVLIPSIIASQFMLDVLPQKGGTWVEMAIVVSFGALFGWISIGFWTALLGFFVLLRGRDRFAITRIDDGEVLRALDPSVKTAIVMPIASEPVERVFAGLRAIYQSLERTGQIEAFEFFVLSDSSDPSVWVQEEEAWLAWCRETGGHDRIFYRRRNIKLKRKNGNVGDFCRRWGGRYRYMIMLDADSVMSGETLVRLVQMMEKHAKVGMIQTVPVAIHRRSVFGRVQQFAARVYGPMFTAGLHFWQLGDGQYWGHNTIIRVEPFMDHCGLPPLPGKPPLGGDILSHDFVEAALMGRAGWQLWLAYDLGGSYEETPSSLLEEMKRDRRWCQGNLQHVRLLFTEGLFGAHRALFLNGALSYMSALLWFGFLLLCTTEAVQTALRTPEYFGDRPSLFPQWPVWKPALGYALLAVTGAILFLPKVLSVVLVIMRGARPYGGAIRLILSVPIEILLSSLFAPIRMVFHTRFVLTNLMGRTVGWKSQPREDAETSWHEAVQHHGLDTVLATMWAVLLYWLSPGYFFWVLPVAAALVLSVPISVLVSKIGLGDSVRRIGLFLIPEETQPPRELVDLAENLERATAHSQSLPERLRDGFTRAVTHPCTNALHRTLLGRRRKLHARIRDQRTTLMNEIVPLGPQAASLQARKALLADPDVVDAIHWRVWREADPEIARRWGVPA
ncbi:MAG TPA: glucans biosynthesis glucosyltransferase MdoH [Candidatus Limnocylindrales bacterium]|nr:glucans biosynthesis glucosyltransferase MdoH [Candidatus Limnocylindrales bacterium]